MKRWAWAFASVAAAVGLFVLSQWWASQMFAIAPYGGVSVWKCGACGRTVRTGTLNFSRLHVIRFPGRSVEVVGTPGCAHQWNGGEMGIADGPLPSEYFYALYAGYGMLVVFTFLGALGLRPRGEE